MLKFATVLAFLFTATNSFAAEVGEFFSPIGDSVKVDYQPDGRYLVTIDTWKNGATCHFEKMMDEVEEGDLRYESGICQLRVLQTTETTLSVSEWSCEQFCEEGVNLRITRAVRD